MKNKKTAKIFLKSRVAYTGQILEHDKTHVKISACDKKGPPVISKDVISAVRYL